MSWPFEPPIKTMEARTSEKWPKGEFAYEPKWDGFRAVAWSPPGVRLDSRNQRPLLRYFPELEPALEKIPTGTVIDSEVVVVISDSTSFDSLQLRIHPAQSRVDMLSDEIPAELVAFDLLAANGQDLRELPFTERRERLVALFPQLGKLWHLTPSTTGEDTARRWFDEFEPAGCDGIIAKKLDQAYIHGKRAMIKIKHRRTVDCVVGGFREHKDGGKIGSILLGLYNEEGDFHFIGHCSGFPDTDRIEILKQLSQIQSDESFGGDMARVPGGESRWSGGKDLSWTPVRPGIVCEVSYDQLEGQRFRHATRFHRWRPDKEALECTMDQLERPDGLGFSKVVS